MENNTTNEGMVNNSNQPSQTEKLNGMINKKITDLTEKLGKIGSEINELKKIEVTDEITKIVVGSTEFNIEDFMSEPDIHKYRNWLDVKKELEEKSEDDVDELIREEQHNQWCNTWDDYVYSNSEPYDVINDVWDYLDWDSFINNHLNPDSDEISHLKEEYVDENCDDNSILNQYVKDSL